MKSWHLDFGRVLAVLAVLLTAAACDFLAGQVAPSAGGISRVSGATSGPIFGTVQDEFGKPGRDVKVTAYLNNTSPLAGNSGGALAGNAGSALNGANPFWTNAVRSLANGTSVRTNQEGRFVIEPPKAGAYNIEAVLNDGAKAWKAEVRYGGAGTQADAGTLRLAPTGEVVGRVRAAQAGVTDLSNTSVYIPGSSYIAITKPDGSYAISNVPVGSFDLAAFHVDLGDARLPDPDYPGQVKVTSSETTTAPNLILRFSPPELLTIQRSDNAEPTDNGAPGTILEVKGRNFALSRGTKASIEFTRATQFIPERLSDELLRVSVPSDAHVGKIVVIIGGRPSNDLPFRVMREFTIDIATLSLSVDATADLSAYVKAFDTDGIRIVGDSLGMVKKAGPNISWSADSNRASVSPGGVVRALSEGTVTIVAKAGSLTQRSVTVSIGASSATPAPVITVSPGTTPSPASTGVTPTPEPVNTFTPTPAASPTSSPTPMTQPSGGWPQGVGSPAPDDTGDPSSHHDYLVSKDGVTSTFVWIPVFTAYQVLRPASAGHPDLPVGAWVRNEPGLGVRNTDWAAEVFGGFYAAKFEATRADAKPGSPTTGASATPGSSSALKVAQYCVPWTNITWDQAATAASSFYPGRSHLMNDDEWTSLSVWSMIQGITVYGNNAEIDTGAALSSPHDIDDPLVIFLDDPSFGYSSSGIDRALTGSGRRVEWSGAKNLTTHMGSTSGVFDLNGNVWEWTGTVGAVGSSGNYMVNGQDTGVSVGQGYVSALSTDPRLRRYGLPGATSGLSTFFGGDYLWKGNAIDIKAFRGGDWVSAGGSLSGVWAVALHTGKDYKDVNLGFRPCIRY